MAIEAGRELVVRHGPSGLTARGVASAMGYTAGTLYNVFENLEELTAAINIESMSCFAEKLRRELKTSEDTREKIRLIAGAYLDFHRQEPELWALLFATRLDYRSAAYQRAIHQIFDQVIAAFLPLCFDIGEARRKAKILWATLHGICLLQESDKLNIQEEDSSADLVAMFLDQFVRP